MVIARKPEFWSAWVIVPIISFSYVQHGLGSFLGWGLVMKGKSYQISTNLLISAAINIGLNFVFIPHWGIIGAAFATLISYILWNGLKIYYSAKFYGLHFDLRRLGNITAVGFGLYFLSLFIANTASIPLNLGIKFLTLMSYPIIFFVTGFFNDKEIHYMQALWTSLRMNGIRATYAQIKTM
jgi:O-antigen/teichoic acid export membrane protein